MLVAARTYGSLCRRYPPSRKPYSENEARCPITGGALAAGVVEAWHLRDAYREAVNKVASEIGRRHMVAWEKAERVGHALAGARLANQESQTTETFSPAQALQAREKQLESQGKLADGAVKALDQFQKDKERKDAFAEAGRTVAAGLAE